MSKRVSRARQYTDEQRINAAVLYAHQGSFSQVSRDTGTPRTTLIEWSKLELWVDAVVKARHQINDKILAQNLANAISAGDELADRIENGDQKLLKVKRAIKHDDGSVEISEDYELRAEPMKGRDLAVVTGITQDKARVQMGLATSISSSPDSRELCEVWKELSRTMRKEISKQRAEKQINVVATQEKDEEKE